MWVETQEKQLVNLNQAVRVRMVYDDGTMEGMDVDKHSIVADLPSGFSITMFEYEPEDRNTCEMVFNWLTRKLEALRP